MKPGLGKGIMIGLAIMAVWSAVAFWVYYALVWLLSIW